MAGTKTSEISSFMKSIVYSGAFNEKQRKAVRATTCSMNLLGEDRRDFRFNRLRQI